VPLCQSLVVTSLRCFTAPLAMNMFSTPVLCMLLSGLAMFLQGCCTPGFGPVPAFHIPLTAPCQVSKPGYCGAAYIHGKGGGDKYSSLAECAAGCDEVAACATYNWCPETNEGCTGKFNKNGCWFFPEGGCEDHGMKLNYAGGGYTAYQKFSLKSLEQVSTGAQGYSLPTLAASFFMGMLAMGGVATGIMRFRRISAMEVLSTEDPEDAEDAEERLVK